MSKFVVINTVGEYLEAHTRPTHVGTKTEVNWVNDLNKATLFSDSTFINLRGILGKKYKDLGVVAQIPAKETRIIILGEDNG